MKTIKLNKMEENSKITPEELKQVTELNNNGTNSRRDWCW